MINLDCSIGYQLTEDATHDVVHCGTDGKWTEVKHTEMQVCSRVICGKFPEAQHGTFKNLNTFDRLEILT